MPDDVKTVTLYHRDFFEWGIAQSRALRAVRDAIQYMAPQNSRLRDALRELDWDNLAEEIEGSAPAGIRARTDQRSLSRQWPSSDPW